MFINEVFSNAFELEKIYQTENTFLMYNWLTVLRKTQDELYFPEEDDSTKVCFHLNQANTITTHHCSSLDYWWVGLYWD